MKYMKMLALAAIALLAFTGTASATYLTSPAGTTYTSEFKSVSTAVYFHIGNPALPFQCGSSHLGGTISQHGPATTAAGSNFIWSFGTCGYNNVYWGGIGTLEFHGTDTTGNATVTATGLDFTIESGAGPKCRAKVSNTHMGTLTGTHSTGGKAVIDISATLPLTGFLCPSTVVVTGQYTVETPSTLDVH